MQGKTYQIFFIYISSLYASEHCWFVGSQWTNQESGKTIGLIKKYLHGNNTEIDRGKMAATAGITASILGIGMRALPNDLSSREINSSDKSDTSSLLKTTNDVAVFGMYPGEIESNQRQYNNRENMYRESKRLDSESETSSMTNGAYSEHQYLLGNVAGTRTVGPCNTSSVGSNDQMMGSSMGSSMVSIDDNEDSMQDYNIHTQEQTPAGHIRATKKRGRMKIYAGIGCFLMVVGVVTTALILKYTIMNKEKPIGKLFCPNDSISIPATKTTDQITEITTEPWPITQQDGINSTSSAGEATTVQNARVDKISFPADICEPYSDIKVVCSEQGRFAADSCMVTMFKCMNTTQHPDQDIKIPTTCRNGGTNSNIREYFYGNFTKKLNGAIQKLQNISRLNCAATFNGFNKTIQRMLNRYDCPPNEVFKNEVQKKSLELCNAFKEGKASISEMCLAQKHIMLVRQSYNDWPTGLIGSIGVDTQHRFVNCTRTYDRNYFTKHLSPEEH